MNLRMWKGIFDSETATIIFPTTLDEVQKEMRGLEEFGKRYGPVRGVDGEGPAQVLTGRVRVDDLNTEAGIQNLNRLAEVIDRMGSERLNLLSGALALEQAKDLPKEAPLLIITDCECDRLNLYGRDHAFLVPRGKSLPFPPKGPVFYLRD